MQGRRKRLLMAMMLTIAAMGSAAMSGCVVAPVRPGCVWVRGHWTGGWHSRWIPAHWRC